MLKKDNKREQMVYYQVTYTWLLKYYPIPDARTLGRNWHLRLEPRSRFHKFYQPSIYENVGSGNCLEPPPSHARCVKNVLCPLKIDRRPS